MSGLSALRTGPVTPYNSLVCDIFLDELASRWEYSPVVFNCFFGGNCEVGHPQVHLLKTILLDSLTTSLQSAMLG